MLALTVNDAGLDTLGPVTLGTAATFIGSSRYLLAKMQAAGYLADLNRSTVVALGQVPFISTPTRLLPVAQASPAKRATGEGWRRWVGDHARLPDAEWLDAVRGDWNGAVESVLDVGLLAIGLGGFITGLLRVTGAQPVGSRETNLVRFDAELLARMTGPIGRRPHLGRPTGGFTEQERGLAEVLPGARFNPVSGPSIGLI